MAISGKYIPIVVHFEGGQTIKTGESAEQFFERSRKAGWSDDPLDNGGATMLGITLATYATYRKNEGLSEPAKEMLRNISFGEWKSVLKEYFWDRWLADDIKNQSVANLLVDWLWGSGVYGIKYPQQILGVYDDGIVGSKTIAAINNAEQSALFADLWNRRKKHFEDIVKRNPSQAKWLKGWMNRLNELRIEN
jgi:lysozyme family protein